MTHPRTPERAEILSRMWAADEPLAAICKALGMSKGAVYDYRVALGLKSRAGTSPETTPWTPERLVIAKQLYIVEGQTADVVAAALKTTRGAVIGICHRKGWLKDARRKASAPAVCRSHVRPPKPGPQSKPALVIGSGFTIAAPADVERVKAERLKLGQEALRRAKKVTVESPNARPFMEARAGCKWPIGEGLTMLSCCNPIERGSYCAGHRAIALSPVQPRPLKAKDAVGLSQYCETHARAMWPSRKAAA